MACGRRIGTLLVISADARDTEFVVVRVLRDQDSLPEIEQVLLFLRFRHQVLDDIIAELEFFICF